MVLPRYFIEDGVARYEGNEKLIARAALQESDVRFHGLRYWLVTADRVTYANTCPNWRSKYTDVLDEYSADVQLYTIFGLPYGELRIRCEASAIPFIPESQN
jgi:hypothetical protein